jgi:hypothetical protein
MMNVMKRINTKTAMIGLLSLSMLGSMVIMPDSAEARRHWRDNGRWSRDWGYRDRSYRSYKTDKIIKGALVGAGVGAGAAVVTDRPVLRTSLIGAGIGAGVQALRY